LAFVVFASLTPHRQPTPKNGLRNFSVLSTRHPKVSEAIYFELAKKLEKIQEKIVTLRTESVIYKINGSI
jgi:hypothetical protein